MTITDQRRDLTESEVSDMLPRFVVGGLVAHVINNLLSDNKPDHDSDPNVDGCCPRCCAPCASLMWLRDNAPTWTSISARKAVGNGRDWQNTNGSINWELINACWGQADAAGCHSEPGVASTAPSVATRWQQGAATQLGMTVEDYMARLAADEKWCTGCRRWHPRSDFGSDRCKSDGLRGICRAADRAAHPAKPKRSVSNAGSPRLVWHDIRVLRAARDGDLYSDSEGSIWRKDRYAHSGRQPANGPGRRAVARGLLKFGADGVALLTAAGHDALTAVDHQRGEANNPTNS